MSFPHVALTLSGVKENYYLIKVDGDLDALAVPCHKCGGSCNERASLIQYGFWEDRHLLFAECLSCHALQAIQQDMPFYWEVTDGTENQQ
jgi:hypothetical protein